MEDKESETAPPVAESQPRVSRNVPRCLLLREVGLKKRINTAPLELQWAAEDGMVRDHTEFRCQLPDVTRSTFLVVFSPDGKKVASTHGNHNVYVTDLASGKNIKTLTGHPRTPWCIAFHPSSNQILASGCLGGQVRVWDLTGGSEIWMAESQTVIASLAFHPVDRMLVIASYNELHFWDWSQPEPFAKCCTANEKEKVRYVAFDTLGHKLMTGVANLASRPQSQWDRVAAPQPTTLNTQLDSERRITICYRYMVEQYEQLVQRYYDLSRTRSTLTMDRGTDPMECEGESSDSTNNNPEGGRPRRIIGRRLTLGGFAGQRSRPLSGTDEASASHSSTNFLTPPEPDDGPPVSQPLLASSSSAESIATEVPRRTLRFDVTLPSFTNFRTRSASVSTPTSTDGDPPSLHQDNLSPESMRSRPLSRLSLSPETIGFGINQSDSAAGENGQDNSISNAEAPSTDNAERRPTVRQIVSNIVSNWRRNNNPSEGTRTEIPTGVESENDDSEGFRSISPEPLVEEESPSAADNTSEARRASPSPQRLAASTGAPQRFSEVSAVSQLRSQFHRLQSVYENRGNAFSTRTHVFSPETQAAERRLLNRLNEFLDRPIPEPRQRRLFASRRSAFQPRPPYPIPNATSSLDTIGGVRYGIQLLSRHIDNMQRLCRARLEILQLQQIRRMWEDLQSQIYALHGAVRESQGEERGQAQASNTVEPAPGSSDLLTDDDSDGPSSNGEFRLRFRRTPQPGRRNGVKSSLPRTATRTTPPKRTRLITLRTDLSRRLMTMRSEQLARHQQTASSNQGTSEDQAEASSSTGTSDDHHTNVRGVKRKSRDPDPLFRPSTASASTSIPSTSAANSTSSLAAVMRETIIQLENMVRRHRQTSTQRNTRLSRYTRPREERMMRHLWDTESSHESSRDDQSEGDISQQVLLLMVDSLTQFFENDNLSRRTTNEALNDRIHNLYVLLQLALNLTDLLLAQLVTSRRELESRRSAFDCGSLSPRHRLRYSRRYSTIRNMNRNNLPMQRNFQRRNQPTSTPAPPTQPRRPATTVTPSFPAMGPNYTYTRMQVPQRLQPSQQPIYLTRSVLQQPRPVVPIVRVNDLPPPPPEDMPSPRRWPPSPPHPLPFDVPPRHPPFTPHRFLHPSRYMGGSAILFDESTSEDSSSYDRSGDFSFLRASYGGSSVFLTDTSQTPHHRIQAWDFSKYKIPDLSQAEKNIVVGECKIHNDASVDISKDGRLLVTLLPSGRLNMTTFLGIYSLQWSTLGHMLYKTSFEQSIVSVSLSPTSRHLVAGLASRRVAMVTSERHANAQVFRLEGASLGRKDPLGARGNLLHVRDLELSRHLNFISLNCIRWAPIPGQGLVYGTNTGQLKILR